jgi:hypothetical protein
LDLLRLYSNIETLVVRALQELKKFFSGRGSSIFWLGFEYLWRGVQDLFVLSRNTLAARVLALFECVLGFPNMYSNCPQTQIKTIKSKGFEGKNWSRIRRTTPDTCEIQFCIQHIIFFEIKMQFIFF